MARVPYEIVAIEADRIVVRMVIAPDWELQYYWDLYIAYIEACGWTRWEFDNETIRRIDRSWENILTRKWN